MPKKKVIKEFQYEIGKEYEHEGEVECCISGLHFYENPLDVLNYYPPADSRYCKVEGAGKIDRNDEDSKYRSVAIDTRDWSVATNTGNQSVATNTGDQSATIVEGKESVAMAVGCRSKAKGALGCWLVLTEWDNEGKHIIDMQCQRVDGENIKANTWYKLTNGEFKTCEEQ